MSLKSKTKKNCISRANKKELWKRFDEDYSIIPLENCLYDNSKDRDFCTSCKQTLIVGENGFSTCTNKSCGIIYSDTIDQTAEWRYYGADDNQGSDPTRAGPPINPLLIESSFGCKVVCQSRTSYEMRKIRRYTEWQSMPYKEKAQYDEFQRISILASQAGIPKLMIDDAIRYHKMISETKTFRGLNRHGIIAASIYVSSRLNGFPRTAKEIAVIFNLDSTSTTKGCKNALSIINELEHNLDNEDKTILCTTTPLSFIDRYCSRLNINCELTMLCKFIATIIVKKNLIPENTPLSIAAGIVYYVANKCNLQISKKAIHKITEISEVTINKCFRKLEMLDRQLIPNSIQEKYYSSD